MQISNLISHAGFSATGTTHTTYGHQTPLLCEIEGCGFRDYIITIKYSGSNMDRPHHNSNAIISCNTPKPWYDPGHFKRSTDTIVEELSEPQVVVMSS